MVEYESYEDATSGYPQNSDGSTTSDTAEAMYILSVAFEDVANAFGIYVDDLTEWMEEINRFMNDLFPNEDPWHKLLLLLLRLRDICECAVKPILPLERYRVPTRTRARSPPWYDILSF